MLREQEMFWQSQIMPVVKHHAEYVGFALAFTAKGVELRNAALNVLINIQQAVEPASAAQHLLPISMVILNLVIAAELLASLVRDARSAYLGLKA